MKPLLSDKYNRKLFYVVSCLAIFSLFCFHIAFAAVAPRVPGGALLLNILSNVLAGAIASSFVTLFILHLTPEADVQAIVAAVESHQKDKHFERARIGCQEWWFRGGTGRFTRAVTLPDLAKRAREENSSKLIVLQLLDFREPAVVETYTAYRRGVKSALNDTIWETNRVKREVCATIVRAMLTQTNEPLLQIEVYLTRSYSLFRIDFSSSTALMTKEDPGDPALRFDRDTFFYNAVREDLRVTKMQGFQVKNQGLSEITEESVRALFAKYEWTSHLDTEDVKIIAELAGKPENPYG